MCNACGFLCCGSDEFGQCGCNWCREPECHDLSEFDDDDDDGYDNSEYLAGICCPPPRAFVCEAVSARAASIEIREVEG